MTNELTRSHEEATIERFRKDPDFAAEYFAAVLHDGDKDELLHAQRLGAKAFPGIDPLKKS
jgi:DNA-binding phage protein